MNNELKIKWKEVFIVQFTDIHSICMEELNKTSEKPQDMCAGQIFNQAPPQ